MGFFSEDAAKGHFNYGQVTGDLAPHTPLERSFVPLIRGTLPPSILDPLLTHYSSRSPAAVSPSNVRIYEMCKVDPGTGDRVMTASRLLLVNIDGRDIAIMKARQREPGSRAWGVLHRGFMNPKDGCPPGTGPFMEVLASL